MSHFLNTTELAARFPWLATSDLISGSLGLSGEGWFDGYSLLAAFSARRAHPGCELYPG